MFSFSRSRLHLPVLGRRIRGSLLSLTFHSPSQIELFFFFPTGGSWFLVEPVVALFSFLLLLDLIGISFPSPSLYFVCRCESVLLRARFFFPMWPKPGPPFFRSSKASPSPSPPSRNSFPLFFLSLPSATSFSPLRQSGPGYRPFFPTLKLCSTALPSGKIFL